MGDDELLEVPEVAELLGLSQDSVRRLFDAGELKGMRTRAGKGGHRRISRASAEAYGRRLRGESGEG